MRRICLRSAARAGLLAALAALAAPAPAGGDRPPAPPAARGPGRPARRGRPLRHAGDRRGDPRRRRRRRRRATLAAAAAILDGAHRARIPASAGSGRPAPRSPCSPATPEAALAELEAAAGLGSAELAALAADPLFAPLAADPRSRRASPRSRPAPPPRPAPPVPAPVAGGAAPVAAANTAWNPATERLEPRFAFPPAPAAPVLPARPKRAALDILREHARRGRAAGNHGDLYDNRDRGHSTPRPGGAIRSSRFVAYAPAARAADLDYGLNDRLLFGRPTFGNSSTAITARPALAQPAAAGADPRRRHRAAPALAERQPRTSSTSTPRTGTSATSAATSSRPTPPTSWSAAAPRARTQPFLEAVALILAAFRPDTKARLVEENLVVPTVQMVFRRSPAERALARGLLQRRRAPGRLRRLRDQRRPHGQPRQLDRSPTPSRRRCASACSRRSSAPRASTISAQGLSEQLFDTPAAIARIWRSKAGRRTMLVSAEDTRDPNGRPLDLPLAPAAGRPREGARSSRSTAARRARITLDWHDPFPISEEDPLTDRPRRHRRLRQQRRARQRPGDPQLVLPARRDPHLRARPRRRAAHRRDRPRRPGQAAKAYPDPMLVARADWRDDFAYAPDGTPARLDPPPRGPRARGLHRRRRRAS